MTAHLALRTQLSDNISHIYPSCVPYCSARTLHKIFLSLTFLSSVLLSFDAVADSPPAPSPQLPLSSSAVSPDSLEMARLLCQILKEVQLDQDIDQQTILEAGEELEDPGEVTGYKELAQKIEVFVKENRTIDFRMVGFPFKSQNLQKKVITPQPDMAERSSLEYLNAVMERLSKKYAPGAVLTLTTDGLAFGDVVGLAPETLKAYETSLKKLAEDLRHIRILTSEDLLEKNESMQQMLTKLEKGDPVPEQFEERLRTERALPQELAILVKRLKLEFDHPEGAAFLKETQNSIESIARKILLRSLKFGAFLRKKNQGKTYIPVSVHFQQKVDKKFGMKLSPTSCVTPWHGVLVLQKDGTGQIYHRKDLDLKGLQISGRFINGLWCPYYRTP